MNRSHNSRNSPPTTLRLNDLARLAVDHFAAFPVVVDPKYQLTWFHKLMAEALERAYYNLIQGKPTRLILELPPRHGKSELATIKFPAWVLGRSPQIPIIVASYAQSLAEDFGQKTRDIMQDESYRTIFSTRLRDDSKAKGRWITKQGGSYTAAGVGGGITGRGFCFPAGTLIASERGLIPIEDCYNGTRVLSWNHGQNKLEWKEVEGLFARVAKGITRIASVDGHRIAATNDHPLFVFGRGYVEAEDIKVGDEVGILQTSEIRDLTMYSVFKGIFPGLVRVHKACTHIVANRLVLQQGMFRGGSRRETSPDVSGLPSRSEQNENIELLRGLPQQKKIQVEGNIVCHLWKVRETIKSYYEILLKTMQGQFSLTANEGQGKLKLSARNGIGRIPARVLQVKTEDIETRRASVLDMRNSDQVNNSPQRSKPEKQHGREFNNDLCNAPRDSSRVKAVAVSAVASSDEEQIVYNLQVKDNHNFFADKFLVHNCIGIIDDPLKNREEADSQTYRDKVWDWYRSTFYTRQEGRGAIIVIATRWHRDDLIGRIEEQENIHLANGQADFSDEWEYITLPAIAKEDEEFEIYGKKYLRKKGEALWPAKFSLNNLRTIENTLGPYEFSSLYQQHPIPSERQEFRDKWFKPWDGDDMKAMVRGNRLQYFTMCDPNASEEEVEANDEWVVTTIAKERNSPNIYRIEESAGKGDTAQLLQAIFRHVETYKGKFGIETVNAKALMYAIKEEQKKRETYFTVYELQKNRRLPKEIRVRGMIPRYSAGVIFHMPDDKIYEQQLKDFPKGKHDDRIDSMTNFVEMLEQFGLTDYSDDGTGQDWSERHKKSLDPYPTGTSIL